MSAPSTRNEWVWIDMGFDVGAANQNVLRRHYMPFGGTVKSVYVGINTVLTTGGGILTVYKNAVNLLSSASYNLGAAATPDLVAATPEAATLTTAASSLKLKAGDVLNVLGTLTTAAVSNHVDILIGIEPDFTA